MRVSIVTLGAAALAVLAAAPAQAQREEPRESPRERAPRSGAERRAEPLVRMFGPELAPDRAVIGVALGESGTRGIRVEEVAPDGPAAQAGIRAGDYLTAVGDASLRLDPADADDPVLRATAERRLRRALERATAGDEVTLRVSSGDAERTVRVRTVRADRLEPARAPAERPERVLGAWGGPDRPDRATLGLTVGSTGTARDTLGAFVHSVVPGSPAERAGVVEGVRIAAVNGVELRADRGDRTSRDDAPPAGRLESELRKLAPGDEVTLRVYDGGRHRDVRVRTAKASEIYGESFRMPPGVWLDGTGPVRVFRDGDTVRVETEGLESLPADVRERIERRLEDARRQLRSPDARWRVVRPQGRRVWSTI